MIFLLLALFYKHFLFPKVSKKLDRIDHALLWTIKTALVVLFFTLPDLYSVMASSSSSSSSPLSQQQQHDNANHPGQEFFFDCSGGNVDGVRKALEEHPQWVNARTENGETPLHLTGIYGHSEITKLLLQKGADPNARSTFEQGLRMHPLSWNIYGGHVENIQLLLEFGANVNLDFDSMKHTNDPVTALDVLLELQQNEAGDERFVNIEKVLREYGAKTMKEVMNDKEEKEEL
mmetsp:Transcript_14662/g.25405  ORF Transcript_14662/g.25405 Transcript_14662/m.25405 type:complete len:233 (-) Transcript_14662:213-911(-)